MRKGILVVVTLDMLLRLLLFDGMIISIRVELSLLLHVLVNTLAYALVARLYSEVK